MVEISQVSVKDLLSTGYFFEELKNHSKSTEIDFLSYSRDYVVPYLIRISESHQRVLQPAGNKILSFACDALANADDDEMVDAIFGLKKVAASEIEVNEKLVSQIGQHDKFEVSSCHHKTKSAESLLKLLVNIIRMFKLAEVIAKQDNSEKTRDSVGDAIKHKWQVFVQQSG